MYVTAFNRVITVLHKNLRSLQYQLFIVYNRGSQPLIVCGPLLETLNTSGPLSGFKIFYPSDKQIKDPKKGLHYKSKGFSPKFP